jgi:hypothetical protein
MKEGDVIMSKIRFVRFSIAILASSVLCVHANQEGNPLRFGISGSVESTDNRDATESSKQSNVDFFLRPYIAYHLEGEVTRIDFRYQPGLRYRTEPGDDQNEVDLQHMLRLHLQQGFSERTRGYFQNTFLQIDDPRISEGGAISRADRSYILNTARAGLNHDVGRLSNLDVSLHSQVRKYDDSLISSFSDKSEFGGGFAFRHSLTPTLRGLANAQYTSYSFKNDGFISRDFDSIAGSLGLEYVFIPTVVGSVSAGLQTRSFDDSRFDSDDNLYVNAELSGSINPDLRVGVLSGFGVRDADVSPYPSQEYTEVRGFADLALSGSFSLRGALTYRTSSYDVYPQLGLPGGDEDVIVADGQITFKSTESTSFILGHRFEDVSADTAGLSGSFTRNTTRIGMTLDF